MSQTTKWAMAMALKHIMTQKPLSKITITDITEACGINRMTFYYHFQDIFDLIDWICQEEGASEKKLRIIFVKLFMICCLMLCANYPRIILFL